MSQAPPSSVLVLLYSSTVHTITRLISGNAWRPLVNRSWCSIQCDLESKELKDLSGESADRLFGRFALLFFFHLPEKATSFPFSASPFNVADQCPP
ncbi:uncharacterized protein YALI1_A16230g [Yarrowia lipolytica]|uniref:Uncharacterized protein n=1 Tax=Yarrowia lipolytica TaxID=4952 RepID=A0A1D8N516_YARLL|nr:hypothetical protein YALI1_A16230g [Yarrowia lipolytica]